ncbi:uncharacterized protein TNCV_1537661 [Trichonephila clavipes]|nr:uncharacterized protein TNCV_1537661 [Trichonephila clavipes]
MHLFLHDLIQIKFAVDNGFFIFSKAFLTSTHHVKSQRISQECDEETWMACDADDCGFQTLNDDEMVTSVQAEFDPVDDETGEDEDINNESSKVHQMLTHFLR